jgi:hypothetical protein
MLLLALPLTGLYFLGIWSGRFVGEHREVFRLWKAWPVLLGALLFAAVLLNAERIKDWAHEVFASDAPAPAASPAPPGGPTAPGR